MSMQRHLASLEPGELTDLYRQWAASKEPPSLSEEALKKDLRRLMTDRDRVQQRYGDLPSKCRDLLLWLLRQEDYALPLSRVDEEDGDLPVKAFEIEAVAFALKKQGFLAETRDRSWVHYQEPVYRVPGELGDLLSQLVRGRARTLENQLSLRAYLQIVPKDEVRRRIVRLAGPPELADDPAQLVEWMSRPETVEKSIALLGDRELQAAAQRVVHDLGGVGEARQLARLGCEVRDPVRWRTALEESLLGTILNGDLTDVGLQVASSSVVVFLDVMKGMLGAAVDLRLEEEPEPPADPLADLAAIRTFLDHHSVRVTRDGALYRATLRKMESELLSPGSRPVDLEDALAFLLRFLVDADLIRADDEGRMRTTKAWKDFESRGPLEQTEQLLSFAQNELRDAHGAFHLPRLRKIFLALLREHASSRWVSLRSLAILARNRYLATLDRQLTADRFQKRYKFVPIPPLVTPAVLVRELVLFGGEALALCGIVNVAQSEEQPVAVRLTRIGAAVLGLPVQRPEREEEGALVVTADFEIVLFPDLGGVELIHEVGRFARREKADYSLHFRISERSVQEAVALGMTADEMLALLRRHARHEIPRNVEQSLRAWAAGVRILEARRTLILRAPSREILDTVLKVREVRAIAGERLNETTLELSEDPTSPRVAEALRSAGFFLR